MPDATSSPVHGLPCFLPAFCLIWVWCICLVLVCFVCPKYLVSFWGYLPFLLAYPFCLMFRVFFLSLCFFLSCSRVHIIHISFICLPFSASDFAGVCMLRLSYPVWWHGLALPTALTVLSFVTTDLVYQVSGVCFLCTRRHPAHPTSCPWWFFMYIYTKLWSHNYDRYYSSSS